MNRQNRRQMLRLYLGMLLSVLLASLFFSGLYRFNNKYTQHTTQPINGLLILSEADMEQHPSRYLWHDWAYYPNVLLTPADFQDGRPRPVYDLCQSPVRKRMDLSGQSGQTQLGAWHLSAPHSGAQYPHQLFSGYAGSIFSIPAVYQRRSGSVYRKSRPRPLSGRDRQPAGQFFSGRKRHDHHTDRCQ